MPTGSSWSAIPRAVLFVAAVFAVAAFTALVLTLTSGVPGAPSFTSLFDQQAPMPTQTSNDADKLEVLAQLQTSRSTTSVPVAPVSTSTASSPAETVVNSAPSAKDEKVSLMAKMRAVSTTTVQLTTEDKFDLLSQLGAGSQ